MRDRKHIQEVERCLKNALKRDKARVEVSRISKFGLLELSRQRLKPALEDETSVPCPYCAGQGLVRSPESVGLTVVRKIQGAMAKGNIGAVRARVPLQVANYLLNQKRERLLNLEREYSVSIQVEGDANLIGSQLHIAYDKKEAPAVEEEPLTVSLHRSTEAAAAQPSEPEKPDASEEVIADIEPADALVLREKAAAAAVLEPMLEVAISAEGAGSSPGKAAEPSGENITPPPAQPVRRYGRFWWLRRLVSTTRSPEEASSEGSHGEDLVPDVPAPWGATLAPIATHEQTPPHS